MLIENSTMSYWSNYKGYNSQLLPVISMNGFWNQTVRWNSTFIHEPYCCLKPTRVSKPTWQQKTSMVAENYPHNTIWSPVFNHGALWNWFSSMMYWNGASLSLITQQNAEAEHSYWRLPALVAWLEVIFKHSFALNHHHPF